MTKSMSQASTVVYDEEELHVEIRRVAVRVRNTTSTYTINNKACPCCFVFKRENGLKTILAIMLHGVPLDSRLSRVLQYVPIQ